MESVVSWVETLGAWKLNSSSCRSSRATRRSAGIEPPRGEQARLDQEPRRPPRHPADLPHSASRSQRAPNDVRCRVRESPVGTTRSSDYSPAFVGGGPENQPLWLNGVRSSGETRQETLPNGAQGGGPETRRGTLGQPPGEPAFGPRAAAARACPAFAKRWPRLASREPFIGSRAGSARFRPSG
jgi:hypothetical protein